MIVPYNLQFGKLKSDYEKGFKSADVMGAVQHNAFFSIQSDNTVLIEILIKNNLPGHSRHLDEKDDALINIFRYLNCLSDMDDLIITCRDYMNVLKM